MKLPLHECKRMRLRGYDYSQDGIYFVTICIKDRGHYFGKIVDQTMHMNKNGIIANQCWMDLPKHYGNCVLDEFVVMPNHVHGIVVIDNSPVGNGLKPYPTTIYHGLSEIIRGFKTFSSRKINASDPNIYFRWQKSFHDRIVRTEQELNAIRVYIRNNSALEIEIKS